jgi:hypothetical protein
MENVITMTKMFADCETVAQLGKSQGNKKGERNHIVRSPYKLSNHLSLATICLLVLAPEHCPTRNRRRTQGFLAMSCSAANA